MSDAEEFFYEHAGFSYDPATETPEEGRRRCARETAEAEAWGKSVGLEFDWSDDWEVDHVKEFPDAYDKEPSTCEICTAMLGGEIVASLGCVDDATDEYRRVVEAELASEVKHDRTGPRGQARLYHLAVGKLLAGSSALSEARGILAATEEGQTPHNAVTDSMFELEGLLPKIIETAHLCQQQADQLRKAASNKESNT